MDKRSPHIAMQFETPEQQHEAASLGMWVFLATEVLLFGGLFTSYAVYRFTYPDVFAEVSNHLKIWLGATNTGILLLSSLTMALAVHASHEGHKKALILFLFFTALLGTAFLGIKGIEWHHEYVAQEVPLRGLEFHWEGPSPEVAQLMFGLYFVMTGLHAFHMIVALGIVGVMITRAWMGRIPKERASAIEISGLYWHLVDIIWVFLFPLLYLVGR